MLGDTTILSNYVVELLVATFEWGLDVPACENNDRLLKVSAVTHGIDKCLDAVLVASPIPLGDATSSCDILEV